MLNQEEKLVVENQAKEACVQGNFNFTCETCEHLLMSMMRTCKGRGRQSVRGHQDKSCSSLCRLFSWWLLQCR